jgi:transcriptional regulator with XRE-family HTH domain
MSELLGELTSDLKLSDKEYRHAYANERLNALIATQIKVLREQREWRQEDVAREADMHQPMISRYENVNYSSWSIHTLKQLAYAFDTILEVKFRSFEDMVRDVSRFSRESLQVPKFADDPFFKEAPAVTSAAKSAVSQEVPKHFGNLIPFDEAAEALAVKTHARATANIPSDGQEGGGYAYAACGSSSGQGGESRRNF